MGKTTRYCASNTFQTREIHLWTHLLASQEHDPSITRSSGARTTPPRPGGRDKKKMSLPAINTGVEAFPERARRLAQVALCTDTCSGETSGTRARLLCARSTVIQPPRPHLAPTHPHTPSRHLRTVSGGRRCVKDGWIEKTVMNK